MSSICSHLDAHHASRALPEQIAGCADCLAVGGTWVHLRMCQSCGHIGCCDSSPNRHATGHARHAGHPIVRSAEPGEDWSWCYLDNVAFVRRRNHDTCRSCTWPTGARPRTPCICTAQILGKIRLATTPPRNHWWNVPLYVDVRGLTTRRLHHRDTTFEITLDFLDHALVIRTADGRTRSFELGTGLPVADFDARTPRIARRPRHRRRHQGTAVRRPDDHAVPAGHDSTRRGTATPSRGSAASWTGPTRCSRSSAAGSTARPARCTCSGTASTSPSPGSPADRPGADRRRSGHPRGLLARGHLVRVLARRRHPRRRRLLLLHRPRTRRATRPAAARRRLDRVRRRLARDPPLRNRPDRTRPPNDAARVLPERLRGRRPPRRLGHDQPSPRTGAPPPTSSANSKPPRPPTSAAPSRSARHLFGQPGGATARSRSRRRRAARRFVPATRSRSAGAGARSP